MCAAFLDFQGEVQEMKLSKLRTRLAELKVKQAEQQLQAGGQAGLQELRGEQQLAKAGMKADSDFLKEIAKKSPTAALQLQYGEQLATPVTPQAMDTQNAEGLRQISETEKNAVNVLGSLEEQFRAIQNTDPVRARGLQRQIGDQQSELRRIRANKYQHILKTGGLNEVQEAASQNQGDISMLESEAQDLRSRLESLQGPEVTVTIAGKDETPPQKIKARDVSKRGAREHTRDLQIKAYAEKRDETVKQADELQTQIDKVSSTLDGLRKGSRDTAQALLSDYNKIMPAMKTRLRELTKDYDPEDEGLLREQDPQTFEAATQRKAEIDSLKQELQQLEDLRKDLLPKVQKRALVEPKTKRELNRALNKLERMNSKLQDKFTPGEKPSEAVRAKIRQEIRSLSRSLEGVEGPVAEEAKKLIAQSDELGPLSAMQRLGPQIDKLRQRFREEAKRDLDPIDLELHTVFAQRLLNKQNEDLQNDSCMLCMWTCIYIQP